MPQQHLIPLTHHQPLRLRNGPIDADPALAAEEAIQHLVVRAEVEARIRPLLDEHVLAAALGQHVAQVLGRVVLGEDDGLVRVRVPVEDEDEVRGVVQRVVHEELEVRAPKVGFDVRVRDERALVFGGGRRVGVAEEGHVGAGDHAHVLARGFFGGEGYDDGRLGIVARAGDRGRAHCVLGRGMLGWIG